MVSIVVTPNCIEGDTIWMLMMDPEKGIEDYE